MSFEMPGVEESPHKKGQADGDWGRLKYKGKFGSQRGKNEHKQALTRKGHLRGVLSNCLGPKQFFVTCF